MIKQDHECSSMTIRQHYKAAALMGILARPRTGPVFMLTVSEDVSRYADLMIMEDEAHEKKKV